ncbi:sigma-54-dependent transcriptional regulator [Desulfobacter latus]|uniref:Sigma-54-dependent Fis family transcriptional regulator n=1 Tax=Desulfobacter latus TaxID=2292 RepID=A0A850TAE5_9BACT|nr:sigma-54 dependent transcriptional regulator [Desulfobacter latus]NWH05197.1 sigma-54-dependent Fis family transcriptional regulator [Desulfobacter latus]
MANVLIVDDDPYVRELLIEFLTPYHYTLMAAETLSECLTLLPVGKFDLILLDINLPDGNGLEILPEIRQSASAPEVIIFTAEGSAAGAKTAMDNEAWDYILKPFSEQEILLNIKRALEFRASKKALQARFESIFDRSDIVGTSSKITTCLNLAAQCAKTDTNVLITGPTGTGKELFANTIHKNSNRKNAGLIVVDCAALPEQLVESVLFGNVKGAFTGADAARDGLIKKADGGTLFLDEIGELPLAIQKKFLRVLQERKFKQVGGTKVIASNFRLISATNRNLDDMAKQNTFRRDLLYRIKTFHIELPALQECREDIKPLTLHYIHKLCEHHGFETKGFKPDFLKMLESYNWPGNIRELITSLEKAILANADASILYPNYLPQHIRLHHIETSIQNKSENNKIHKKTGSEINPLSLQLPDKLFNPVQSLKQVKKYTAVETEKLYLDHVMRLSKGDLEKTCELAGISKSRLYSLLKTHQTLSKP